MNAMTRSIRAFACLLALALFLPVGHNALASGKPLLRLGNDTQHRLLISGSGWKPGSRIALSVHVASITAGRELRADRGGTFALAITRLSLCSRPIFQARNLAGQSATLSGPPLGCPSQANPPVPSFHLLQGQTVTVQIARVFGLSPRSVTLRRGDELYVWESGALHPGYQPKVDEHFLSVLRQGTTPARACAQPECDAGFFWQYVALQAGDTAIDLSPACRSVQPPCELADLEVAVKITQ